MIVQYMQPQMNWKKNPFFFALEVFEKLFISPNNHFSDTGNGPFSINAFPILEISEVLSLLVKDWKIKNEV